MPRDREPRTRAGALALMTAVAAVVGLACASSASPALQGSPAAVIRAAADRTDAAGMAQVAMSIGVAVGPGISGTGTVDFRTQRAEVVFQRTGAGARKDDRFDLTVDGSTASLTGAGPTPLKGALPTLAASARQRISPLDDLLVRPGAGLMLGFLRGAVDPLVYGGQEVEGASTMRYSFVIDWAQALAAARTPAERAVLAETDTALRGVEEPADVWLDSQGRVRRLQFATDPRLHTTTTRAHFFTDDYGEYLSFIVIDFTHFAPSAT